MAELVVIRSSMPPPLWEHLNPARMVRILWEHRELTRNFARRDLAERHKGALLGVAWNVISPLLSLAVYTVVFGLIFGASWGRGNPPLPKFVDFPLTLLAGSAIFQMFAESANRASTLVSSRPNLVRRVVFPLEILPVAAVRAGLVHTLIIVGILLVVLAAVTGGSGMHWTIVLLPAVLAPLVMVCLGVSWALAAVGVFVRDVRHIVAVVTQLLMFTTPLFYPLDRISPEHVWLRRVIETNPLSVLVESGRRVVLWGEAPDWWRLGWVTVFAAVVMMGGFFVFSAMRRSMADVH
ncbi:MAG TPA: ABC transporter permease [Phycisphaerales bacterium]|nr:ABC transporter permease [Phycisphaerales bacterium]